jgi:tRNA(Ile)-lysidine synthase
MPLAPHGLLPEMAEWDAWSLPMSSMFSIPAVPNALAATAFLQGLAAGLPADPGRFPVVVGVSGGADSVALLLGLIRLGFPPGGRLVVAHAEHDLRVEAGADRAFVEALAEGFGVDCVARRLSAREGPGGEGLEARARRLRYDFLGYVAREVGARQVLVAHTADDQAETILHRILRGTGPGGLAGMRRCRSLVEGVAVVRPLLVVWREAVRPFLEAAGHVWREDATNADVSRARNFLRHEVLPRCRAGCYPHAAAALLRLAGQAAATGDALASAAAHMLDIHGRRDGDGAVRLQRSGLEDLHPHLRSEVFAALWRRENWPRRDMTADHYHRLAEMVGGQAGPAIDCPGGVQVTVGPAEMTLRPPRA